MMSRRLVLALLAVALAAGATAARAERADNDAAPAAAAPRASMGNAEAVVLIHGYGRSKRAMWRMDRRLSQVGFDVIRIGYPSLFQTPESILAEVVEQMEECCAGRTGKVHFVGHSLGGLMVRAYLGEHRPQQLGNVVLMGSPSGGTPIVDAYEDRWWMEFAGPMAKALGTGSDGFPATLPAPDYPLGVIAGVSENRRASALIPGEDDGLVSVDSTRVDGMADFIKLPVGHSAMRSDSRVARQVIAFLRSGRFIHE